MGRLPDRGAEIDALRRPEESASEWLVVAGIYLFSALYLLFFRRLNLLDPDEGIILQGAQRILEGQVLYRDFFSFFTPGSYYLLALVFKIFGSSFIVARTLLVVYGGLFPVLAYLVARRVCSRWSALLVAFLVATTCLPYRFLVLHNWDSTLLAYLTLYVTLRFVERPHAGWAFGVGSFTALTMLFEQSKGMGVALGLAVGFGVIIVVGRECRLFDHSRAMALGLGFLWPFVLTVGYFAAQHGLHQMIADWFWPLVHYSQANKVFYGYQNWSDRTREILFGGPSLGQEALMLFTISPCFVVPVLPFIALALLGYWAFVMWRSGTAGPRARYFVMACSILSGLLLSAVVVRPDIVHLMYLSPLLYLVLAWILGAPSSHLRSLNTARPLLAVCLLATFTAFGLALLTRTLEAHHRIQTRRGIIQTAEPDAVIEYVQAHVPAGARILVYPYLPLYYFLTGTFSPTPYEYVQPGMHTPDQVREILHQLEAGPPKVVLFEISFDQKIPFSWPNTSARRLATDPIADFILKAYRPCEVLTSSAKWRFVFMTQKGDPCPESKSAQGSEDDHAQPAEGSPHGSR